MKNQQNVTIISRNKTTTVPLHSMPDLLQRVRAAEQQYGVQIIECTFQPAAGNLLTMKYKREESSGAEAPAAGMKAA